MTLTGTESPLNGALDPRQTPSQEITVGERLARLEVKVDQGQREDRDRDERTNRELADLRTEIRAGSERQSALLERLVTVEEERSKWAKAVWEIVKKFAIGAGAAGAGGGALWQIFGG